MLLAGHIPNGEARVLHARAVQVDQVHLPGAGEADRRDGRVAAPARLLHRAQRDRERLRHLFAVQGEQVPVRGGANFELRLTGDTQTLELTFDGHPGESHVVERTLRTSAPNDVARIVAWADRTRSSIGNRTSPKSPMENIVVHTTVIVHMNVATAVKAGRTRAAIHTNSGATSPTRP